MALYMAVLPCASATKKVKFGRFRPTPDLSCLPLPMAFCHLKAQLARVLELDIHIGLARSKCQPSTTWNAEATERVGQGSKLGPSSSPSMPARTASGDAARQIHSTVWVIARTTSEERLAEAINELHNLGKDVQTIR